MPRSALLKTRTKLFLALGFCFCGFALFVVYSGQVIEEVKVSGQIYRQIMLGRDLIADVVPPAAHLLEYNLTVRELLDEAKERDETGVADTTRKLSQLEQEYLRARDAWARNLPAGVRKELLQQSAEPALEFFRIVHAWLEPDVRGGRIARARDVYETELRPLYEAHHSYIDQLVRAAQRRNEANEAAAEALIRKSTRRMVLMGCLLAAGVTLLMAVIFLRGVILPIRRITQALQAIGEGRYDTPLDTARRDEIGVVMRALDATQTRLAEMDRQVRLAGEESRRHLGFLQTLIDHLPAAIYVKSATEPEFGRYILWNRTSEKVFGWTAAQAHGKTAADLFPPEIAELILRRDRQAFETGQIVEIPDERMESRELGPRLMRTAKIPIYDLQGAPLHLLCISEDVTEWTRAQEALRESEQKLRLITQNLTEVVLAYDMAGKLIYANPAVEQLTGYRVAELRERNFVNWIHPDDQERMLGYWNGYFQGRNIHEVEYRLITKAGQMKWVSASWAPLLNEHGVQVGVCGRERDITERKLAQLLVEQQAHQLGKARDEALAALRAKSEFLATISHEIRTPLNGVAGMTGLLLDSPLSAEQREWVETTRNSADLLLSIINEILDYSRIEAGELKIETHPFDLRECVDSAIEVVSAAAAKKGLRIGCRIDPQTPAKLRGDSTRVRQVLLNLLGNAVKFTESGEILVLADARPAEESHYLFHFAVRDTGIGIPKDRLGRLFHSFSQVDASASRNYGGAGLGLAIAKRLSEAMGGAMWVETEEGRGSTFHFTIHAPASGEALAGSAAPSPSGGRPAKARPAAPLFDAGLAQRVPLRILLAEDSEVNQKVTRLMLSKMGYRVDVAGNGLEVLKAFEQVRYDLVLMDMQMPEMDGLEATRCLRTRFPGRSGPWIVAVTANAFQSDREDCLQAGMDDFISKPIQAAELKAALLRCGQRETVPEAGAAAAPLAAAGWLLPPMLRELWEGGQKEDVAEAIGVFLEDTESRLVKLREAIAAGELDTARRLAHTIKGSCLQVGEQPMGDLSRQLEEKLKAKVTEGAEDLLAGLERRFPELRSTIQDFLGRGA